MTRYCDITVTFTVTLNRVITPGGANGGLMEYAEKPSKTSNDRKMTFAVSHNNTKG